MSREKVQDGPLVLRGRRFSEAELALIRKTVSEHGEEGRTALSVRICRLLDWHQDNGRPKARSCRDVPLRLEGRDLLKLPPRKTTPRRRRPIPITTRSDPRRPFALTARDVRTEHFRILTARGRRADETLWNEFIERYHYLGFGVPVGPHIKYFVEIAGEPVACMAFSGAAWKVAPRDLWIGWTHEQRKCGLRYIVNNTRFLILPWIRVKNLASRLLSLACQRLREDWRQLYGYRPLLVETFVRSDRHAGTCYKAADWLDLGDTQGRGKMDRYGERALPRKKIFVFPLLPAAADLLHLELSTPDLTPAASTK